MINPTMRTYEFSKYGALDEYGQDTLSALGTVKMSISLTNQQTTPNIQYSTASYIGLTLDNTLNDECVITYGDSKLKVLYVNNEGRYHQVFMSEIE